MDVIRELLVTKAAAEKLGGRGISIEEGSTADRQPLPDRAEPWAPATTPPGARSTIADRPDQWRPRIDRRGGADSRTDDLVGRNGLERDGTRA